MKSLYIKFALLASIAGSMNSCIDETLPQDNTMTSNQVSASATALNSFATGIAGSLGQYGTCYNDSHYDLGYPGLGIIRDVMCEDMSIEDTYYDYFNWWAETSWLGDSWSTCYYPWEYYYKTIANTHNILRNEFNENNKVYFGIAHFYRAWTYFDLARMFEFKKTGVTALDEQAEKNGISGLTVPIITEKTTEEEARYTPRATCYEMYKFILEELNLAEEYLAGYQRTAKNMPNLAAIYDLKARFYLDLGTRLYNSPTDMKDMSKAKEELGASDYKEAFNLAAEYARKTIEQSGATPLTQKDWYGGEAFTEGFNSVNSNSWILGIIIKKENISATAYDTFAGNLSVEESYGVGGYKYKGKRLISKALFDAISDNDWRKNTWIAPEDAGKNYSNYYTLLNEETFNTLPAYVNFKFRPKAGNMTEHTISAAADYPLMRVEEMYFVEAEAKAYSSLSEAKSLLESFINTYRYTNGGYKCNANSLVQFVDELMLQKRIEFWGEGLVYWDYKRLNKQVVRGYEGSNIPEIYQINSIKGYCAPWFNIYIPNKELGMNTALLPNPDPTQAIPTWSNN